MEQQFTQDLLVKYLFKETSFSEKIMVESLLNEDDVLFEEYELLLNSQRQLPKVKFNPSNSSIHNILRYSEQTTVGTHL